MIELGKYGSTFYVQGKNNFRKYAERSMSSEPPYNWRDIIGLHDHVEYKGIDCRIVSINNDTYGLQLISSNQEDFIPIVV